MEASLAQDPMSDAEWTFHARFTLGVCAPEWMQTDQLSPCSAWDFLDSPER